MTLEITNEKPLKAYVKKLENGFGIKTINTLSGVENVLIVTTDSIKSSLQDSKTEESKSQVLRPLWSKFSEDTVSATVSVPAISKCNYAINKVLAHLEPYLREIKPDIAGFHIFEEGDTKPGPNIQKTSVIFVANTELAKEKGVNFKIPGKLMNMFYVNGQNEEGKIMFEADSIVKPITLIVSDYVLHIDICYDLPSKPLFKTVGTQTRKRYVLKTLIDDHDSPIYKIESFPLSSMQIICEQKSTQTDSNLSIEELWKFSQRNIIEVNQECGTQTDFFTYENSKKSLSSSGKKWSSSLETSDPKIEGGDVEGTSAGTYVENKNVETEILTNSKASINERPSSVNSCLSYDSHVQQAQELLRHAKDADYEAGSKENNKAKSDKIILITTSRSIENNTLTLFDNSLNYKISKFYSRDNVFPNLEYKSSGSLIENASVPSYINEKDSELSIKSPSSEVGINESSTNVSLKDIKERLNKTTLSLQQLYSIIEIMEKTNTTGSCDVRFSKTSDCYERDEFESESSSRETITSKVTQQEPSVEDTNFNKTSLNSNELSTISDFEESEKISTTTSKSSFKYLCERCGSFHSHNELEDSCKLFEEQTLKLIKNKNLKKLSRDSLIYSKNHSENLKNKSELSYNSSKECIRTERKCDYLVNKTQSELKTKIKGSTDSCKEGMKCLAKGESCEHTEAQAIANNSSTTSNGITKKLLEAKRNLYLKEKNENLINEHSLNNIVLSNTKQTEKEIENEDFSEENNYQSEIETLVINNSAQSVTFFNIPLYNEKSSSKECEIYSKNSSFSHENSISDEYSTSTEESYSSGNLTNSVGNVSIHKSRLEQTKDTSTSASTKQNYAIFDDNSKTEDSSAKKLMDRNNIFTINQPMSMNFNDSKECSTIPVFAHINSTQAIENSKIFQYNEVRNTKSWISLKKSLSSCGYKGKLIFKKKTTQSEPNTTELKIKHLSSGDQHCKHMLNDTLSNLEEKFNTNGLFNKQPEFLDCTHSSSTTLNIIPSSSHENLEESNCKITCFNKNDDFNTTNFKEKMSLVNLKKRWSVKSQDNQANCKNERYLSTYLTERNQDKEFKTKFKEEKQIRKEDSKYNTGIKNSCRKSISKNNLKCKNHQSKKKKRHFFCFFI